MSYSTIPSELTASGKAAVKQLFELIRDNFASHQSRINALENFVTPIPTGAIVRYPANSVPTGFLSCDGSAVSRATYATLFSVIGTTYGSGDGDTTFNVPNAEDCVSIGAGSGASLTTRVVGTTVGSNTHALTTGEIPSHSHAVTDPGHTHGFNDTGDNLAGGSLRLVTASTGQVDPAVQTVETKSSGVTIDNDGSGTAHQNMQPYVCAQFIIKA